FSFSTLGCISASRLSPACSAIVLLKALSGPLLPMPPSLARCKRPERPPSWSPSANPILVRRATSALRASRACFQGDKSLRQSKYPFACLPPRFSNAFGTPLLTAPNASPPHL